MFEKRKCLIYELVWDLVSRVGLQTANLKCLGPKGDSRSANSKTDCALNWITHFYL